MLIRKMAIPSVVHQFCKITIISLVLVTLLVSCAMSNSVNRALKSNNSDLQHKLANELFDKKQYNYASTLYERVLPFYRNDENYGNIVFKYGMCAFMQKDYATSIAIFDNLRNSIPNFKEKEQISYLIAKSYALLGEPYFLEQQKNEAALSEAQQFISLYPKSKYVDSCLRIIKERRDIFEEKSFSNANLYYKMGYYKASMINFQSLILNFPDAKRIDYYEYLYIKSFKKVLDESIEEKFQQRKTELLASIENFLETYENSNHVDEVNKIKQGLEKKTDI